MSTPVKQLMRVFFIVTLAGATASAAVDLTVSYRARAGAKVFSVLGIPSVGDPCSWDPCESLLVYNHSISTVVDQIVGAPAEITAEAEVSILAYEQEIPGTEPLEFETFFHTQHADAQAFVQATIVNGTDLQFISSIASNEYQSLADVDLDPWDNDPVGESWRGAWTSLNGTLEIGVDASNPQGTPLTLPVAAVISGDSTRPKWDWSVKVYRDEQLIATLEEGNISVSLDVFAGETLGYEMTHLPEPTTIAILLPGALLALVGRKYYQHRRAY